MSDPDIDRIYRELKEGRLRLAHEKSMVWWQREAAFLYAHGLEGAVEAGMTVGKDPRVEAGVIFMGAKQITIGDDFTCSFGAGFRAVEAPIRIGDKVNVGPLCQVIGANHGMAADRPIGEQPHQSIEVRIGNDVWLGAGSIILPGAKIGDGAVIGAGSVVTGDVPPMSVFAGVPAKKVRDR
jgi:acetyltransferase-like isoleucine patch superfamily enzyme